jgi:hypothetical protein
MRQCSTQQRALQALPLLVCCSSADRALPPPQCRQRQQTVRWLLLTQMGRSRLGQGPAFLMLLLPCSRSCLTMQLTSGTS